jgi:tetratricopeptide (TPR) repeat protein
VIGRSFLYEILKQTSELSEKLNIFLDELEGLDLIRLRSLKPDIEYIFKHALTQEVVYNSLLIDERKKIHNRIGRVIEKIFKDRMPEFYDALAFHYKRAEAKQKAIKYLILSGEKSLKKYSLEESDNYFREAYIYTNSDYNKTTDADSFIAYILIKWALVFYYRGDFKNLLELLQKHKMSAETITDYSIKGMFYAWLGFALYVRHNYKKSYEYLLLALKIGELHDEKEVVGYASTWLTYLYGEMGLFNESLKYAERATTIGEELKSDQYIIFKQSGGVAQTSFWMGDVKKAFQAGELCTKLGKKQGNIRAIVMGHIGYGLSYAASGDFEAASNEFKLAINVSADPMYKNVGSFALGFTYLQLGNFEKGKETLQHVISEGSEYGLEWSSVPSKMLLGAIYTATENMSKGFKMILNAKIILEMSERKPLVALSEFILGKIYFFIMKPNKPIEISFIIRNLLFLLRKKIFSCKKAEYHFNKAITLSKEIGANGILGQTYLELGLLYLAKGRKDLGLKFINDAANIFDKCGAHVFLKQTQKVLDSLHETLQ